MPTDPERYVIDCAIVWAEMMAGQQLRHDVYRCENLLCGAVTLLKANAPRTILEASTNDRGDRNVNE